MKTAKLPRWNPRDNTFSERLPIYSEKYDKTVGHVEPVPGDHYGVYIQQLKPGFAPVGSSDNYPERMDFKPVNREKPVFSLTLEERERLGRSGTVPIEKLVEFFPALSGYECYRRYFEDE